MLISDQDSRNRQIQINTILNICLRGLGILCSFLIVPLALSYIDKSEYGVWLTLTSIISWISYMDVGLGNGLRNKLAEAMASGNKGLARQYVSTTYFVFAVFLGCVFAVFGIANFFLNWNQILKTGIAPQTLFYLTYIIVLSFCFRLLFNLAITVCVAMQKVYVDSLVSFSINLMTLAAIWFLPKFHTSSFSVFCISLSVIPVLVLLIFNYVLFNNSGLKYLLPKRKYFRRKHIKPLLNIGVQFFLIQFVGLIIFSTDNILITQYFSPADVTVFNIVYKYFSIATLAFNILLLPYWSAFTHAYVIKDMAWIKGGIKKLLLFWVVQLAGITLLVVCSGIAFHIWLGGNISIPLALVITFGIYSAVYNWNNIFAYFINGVSKIRLQLLSAIFCGIINIPLSILLIKYSSFGVSSIVIANILCLGVSSVWSPIQCYKIIHNKATGLWDK